MATEVTCPQLDRKNSAELFDGLLTNPLKLSITGGRERYLIVIDALDEAGSASAQGGDGRNELVEVLARYASQLPDWIGLVVTSRPEFDVTTPFQALKPFPFETKSAANSEDIRAYLRHELAAQLQNRPDADRLVEQILEKSEGVFLYVESFCEDIRKNHLSLDRPNEFPQGLAGKFYMDFQRYFPDLEKFRKDVRPALRVILAAREPLPVEILQRLFNWQDEELRDFTRPIASLFPVTRETGQEVTKPYHKSLADWLVDESKAGPYFVSVIEGHRRLGEFGCAAVLQRSEIPGYLLKHLPRHLALCEAFEPLLVLVQDPYFISLAREAKNIIDLLECCADVQDCRIPKAETRDGLRKVCGLFPENLFAVRMHDKWFVEKRRDGYAFGNVRDDTTKPPTHPKLLLGIKSLDPCRLIDGGRPLTSSPHCEDWVTTSDW